MGSVAAPADAFRVGAPGLGGGGVPQATPGSGVTATALRPPPPVRQYRVPSPSRVGGSDAVTPTVRQQRLVPKRRVPEVTECLPRKRPAVGQGLAPGRGVSATTGGGGGGLWRPVFVVCPCHPRGPRAGRGRLRMSVWAPWLSAARRLTPRPPPPPPRASGGGRARLWAVRKLVEGGERWSWRWRLAVAGDQPSEQAVDVGHPPRGLGNSYAWRPPGETSATVEELRTHGTVVLARVRGLGVWGGGVSARFPPRPNWPRFP